MALESITYEESRSKVAVVRETDIEGDFIGTLVQLKYTHRPDIRDRASLETNFREKFQRLNAVRARFRTATFASTDTRSAGSVKSRIRPE